MLATNFLDRILGTGIVAVLRSPSGELLADVAEALLAGALPIDRLARMRLIVTDGAGGAEPRAPWGGDGAYRGPTPDPARRLP